jgi:two-component system chemotaxis response regulator CheY
MNDIKKKKSKLKIMVVDDAELSRRETASILSEAGYNVVGLASSAEEALKLTISNPAHLYIVDVVMPEVSGIELAKRLSQALNNIYIIMMSSLNMENIIIESISSGAIDFLQKPKMILLNL